MAAVVVLALLLGGAIAGGPVVRTAEPARIREYKLLLYGDQVGEHVVHTTVFRPR